MKRNLKRWTATLVAAVIVVATAGCANDVVSQTGSVVPPESSSQSSQVSYPEEFPPADQPLPAPDAKMSESKASEAEQTSSSQAQSEPESSAAESAPSSTAVAESSAPTASEAPAEPASQPPQTVSSQAEPEPEPEVEPEAEVEQVSYTLTADDGGEVRGIWISYLDFYSLAKGQSKSSFVSNINDAFETIADYGLNTVFVQVRPFGDAMYDSDIFPWSYVLTGVEGSNPGYDPLAIMVSSAKQYGLRIEAWINPYRVLAIGSSRELSSANPAVQALNQGKDTAISYNGGIFYNPASKKARALITQGVVELIENYDIDGIHFDDYFYPTTDTAFDGTYYREYCAAGGSLSQADWRRENVNVLIRQVYAAVKATDASVLFGISPQARMDNNYNGQFADVEKWLSSSGYVDYICPQIYYGFDNDSVPYSSTLTLWNQMARGSHVSLYVGLAVYKCGVSDKWAGSGASEWINCTTMLRDMVDEAREQSTYEGFLLYRYDSLFNPESAVKSHIAKERANLQAAF